MRGVMAAVTRPFAASRRRCLTALALPLALVALPVPPAGATYAGHNGPVADAWYDNDQGAHQEILFEILTVPRTSGAANPHTVRTCSSLDGCPQFGHPAYSADGSRLVFDEQPNIYAPVRSSELVLTNASGGSPVVISDPASEYVQPSFAPSGNRLVFVCTAPSTSSGGVPAAGSIVTSNLSGGDLRVVTNLSGSDPVVSPDGRSVVFVHGQSIWAAGINGSNPHRLIGDASMPEYSPSGRKIVYASGSRKELYVAQADGTHRSPIFRRHTHKAVRNVDFPVFSPDGQQIAFAGTDSNLNPYLVRVPAQGGRIKGLWPAGSLDGGGTNLGTAWRPLH